MLSIQMLEGNSNSNGNVATFFESENYLTQYTHLASVSNNIKRLILGITDSLATSETYDSCGTEQQFAILQSQLRVTLSQDFTDDIRKEITPFVKKYFASDRVYEAVSLQVSFGKETCRSYIENLLQVMVKVELSLSCATC